MLLLDERIRDDGSHARSWALRDGDRLRLRDDDGADGALSIAAVDRVMARYGRDLAPDIAAPAGDDVLDLGGGFSLGRLRFHAAVDATGRDYLVWQRPGGGAPLCVVATMATAALRYLVVRLAGERDPSKN